MHTKVYFIIISMQFQYQGGALSTIIWITLKLCIMYRHFGVYLEPDSRPFIILSISYHIPTDMGSNDKVACMQKAPVA